MRCPYKSCLPSHSSALSKISGASWGGEKVSFPSPSPAALSPEERKKTNNPKTPKRHKKKKTKRGRRSGEALGRPAVAGGRAGPGRAEGARLPRGELGGRALPGGAPRGARPGREEVPGRCREPRPVRQEVHDEHDTTFLRGQAPQPAACSRPLPPPRAPARPGPPCLFYFGGGEELGLCPHPPGCWSTGVGEKAGFHLAKNAQRRRGSFPSPPQDFSRSCPKGGLFPPSVPRKRSRASQQP